MYALGLLFQFMQRFGDFKNKTSILDKDFFFSQLVLVGYVCVCVCILFLILILATSSGIWDLSPPSRDQTQALCLRRQSLNHWTVEEVLGQGFF